jgi:hypothetical protein
MFMHLHPADNTKKVTVKIFRYKPGIALGVPGV